MPEQIYAWTFNNIPFKFRRRDEAGAPVISEFRRQPRLVVRPLLGGSDVDISIIGYEPWTLEGPIYVTGVTNKLALENASGTFGVVSNGFASYAVAAVFDFIRIDVEEDIDEEAVWEYYGTAKFIRA